MRGKPGAHIRTRHRPRLIPARAGKTSPPSARWAKPRAHPRACGENDNELRKAYRGGGSSPRVRGKRALVLDCDFEGRLIPARAGKTFVGCTSSPSGSAHPRACGENPHYSAPTDQSLGSSPRVRGKPDDGTPITGNVGLIPARAGKTQGAVGAEGQGEAHPRACGENKVLRSRGGGPPGSSPRVRGKLVRAVNAVHTSGLIPARAGKTVHRRRRHRGRSAHPRACGENSSVRAPVPATTGSSPRVRGKLSLSSRCHWDGGLIPARAGKTFLSSSIVYTPAAHPRACGENLQLPPKLHHGVRLIPARAGKTATSVPKRRGWGAHPRACGENTNHARVGAVHYGSSPRVRGKHIDSLRNMGVPGLIPARAGKTARSASTSWSPWAHPRACGENPAMVMSQSSSSGSSPRVRGKRSSRGRSATPARLIPARAGKTAGDGVGGLTAGAHPRACGENFTKLGEFTGLGGSSPRVRGKRVQGIGRPDGRRLIPARAGKTGPTPGRNSPSRAHPRACGENAAPPDDLLSSAGSSPRVRGKQRRTGLDQLHQGLIPARAGKTRPGGGGGFGDGAHPRACGENAQVGGGDVVGVGSSPRVRGKPVWSAGGARRRGLIPARAGKTFLSSSIVYTPAAHPRACGENDVSEVMATDLEGSSPRVRGKRTGWRGPRRAPGLIPARAGKT